ncbi:hypothetical protein ACIQ6Y_36190 [Streptomyces sp. NPDC096205]|uniref:hypothetical protein n=1 Tax=Streptomyces sp. NPDC096205 TaxID=3366081 RepID=UPI00382ED9FC
MNVPLCAAGGRRPTEPDRWLDEMPGYPGRDGLSAPAGRRSGEGHRTRSVPDAVRAEAAA